MSNNSTNTNFTDGDYPYKNSGGDIAYNKMSTDLISGVVTGTDAYGRPDDSTRHGGVLQSGLVLPGTTPFNGFSKFGYIDPYNVVTFGKEVVFFTRPDLHIMEPNGLLNPDLENMPFFVELLAKHQNVIRELQMSYNPFTNIDSNRFCYLLHNRLKNNVDLPDITSTDMDLPQNMYGNNYTYRGSSESSDDNPTFSLEFEETQNLDVYMFFRAYEEYERLKKLGRVAPPGQWVSIPESFTYPSSYVRERRLHDQIAIYKFILRDDLTTIFHYSKIWGAYPKGVPRSIFNSSDYSNGLSLSVDWSGAFVDDMDPLILYDFNNKAELYADMENLKGINSMGLTNREWAKGAYIAYEHRNNFDTTEVNRLRFRGKV